MSTKPRKIKPSDLHREAEAMIREGSMPSLEVVLQAVDEAREKYSERLKAARLKKSERPR